MDVFLDDADHVRYRTLLEKYAVQFQLRVLAYCLMTNHVHVVAIPEHEDSIARVFRDCHGRYAAEFNRKYSKSGHVWQARPYSCTLDEVHTWAAIRYVERNPVRARMVARAEEYPWSSASAHCGLTTDALLDTRALDISGVGDWSQWLAESTGNSEEAVIRSRTYTGRPCGREAFVAQIEAATGRTLAPRKPGPKPRFRDGDMGTASELIRNRVKP